MRSEASSSQLCHASPWEPRRRARLRHCSVSRAVLLQVPVILFVDVGICRRRGLRHVLARRWESELDTQIHYTAPHSLLSHRNDVVHEHESTTDRRLASARRNDCVWCSDAWVTWVVGVEQFVQYSRVHHGRCCSWSKGR